MKISVIITVFNGEKYLSGSIESFLEQNYQEKELVIVDGISTDKSHEIIESYQKKSPQSIKWIKEKDCGISNARNIGLKHASGDLIGFLGCDDLFHKNFFEEMSYYLKINQSFDVIYFNNYCIGLSNSFSNSASIAITRRNLIKHCPIGSGESFYYRREIFNSFKFNEKNRYCMDYELNMKIVSDSRKYSFFPVNITAVFNQNIGTNQSSLNSIKQRIETIVVQLNYSQNFLEKLKVLWRQKKLILNNLNIFIEQKRILSKN
jgi:glycosyltransferase involved in cell wall biosynthesis